MSNDIFSFSFLEAFFRTGGGALIDIAMVRIILSTELLRGPHRAPPGPHWEPPGPYPAVSAYPVPRKSKLPRARGQKKFSIEASILIFSFFYLIIYLFF
jgi:hypothetical protein